MHTKEIRLKKNGKGFRGPAAFLNPQKSVDAKVLNDANDFYSQFNENSGIPSIDGIVIDAKDWNDLKDHLKLSQLKIDDRRSLSDRIKIIDPGIDFLLRGSSIDRQKMRRLGLFDERLIDRVIEISRSGIANTQKLDRVIKEVYPLIDARLVRDILQFSFDNESSILVRPMVSLTSSRHIEIQVAKAKEMVKTSKTLLSTIFSKYENKIDEMNLLTVSASVIRPESFNLLSDLLLTLQPDHIGIKITSLNNKNESELRNVLDFLVKIHEDMQVKEYLRPVHLMNVDTFGYVAFCYGVCSVTMPIAVDPYYYSRGHAENFVPTKGSYYHIEKKTYVQYDRLRLDTLKAEPKYKLPCFCAACTSFNTILGVDKKTDWNYFRRLHEVLVRDIEIHEIRDSRVPIHRSLRDMMGRSFTPYATLIPDKPIIGF